MPQNLSVGLHTVDAPCPRCGIIVEAHVHLSTVHAQPSDDVPTLRVKAKSKSVEHDCRAGVQVTVQQALDEIEAVLEPSEPGEAGLFQEPAPVTELPTKRRRAARVGPDES